MTKRTVISVVGVTTVVLSALLGVHCLALARQTFDRPFPGFFVYPGGAVAAILRTGWEGPTAGLRPRHVIRSVGGHETRSGPEVAAALAAAPDREVAIVAERPDGSRFTVQIEKRTLGWADIGFTFVLPWAIGWIYFGIGTFIFFLKRTRTGGMVSALCLVASMFYLTMYDAHTTYAWSRVWISYPLLGPLSLHLFSQFPEDSRFHARRFILPIYLAAGVLVACRQLLLHGPPGAFDVTSFLSGVYLALCFLGDLALLGFTVRRGASPEARNKAKTIAVGLVLTVALAVIWAFVSRLGPSYVTADAVMVLSALFPILIAYATLKRNLFDLDVVLQASVAYGVATAVVIALYFAVVTVLGTVLSGLASRITFSGATTGAVISTLIVAALFNPLRQRIHAYTSRIFLGGRLDRADALHVLLADLPAARKPDELGEQLVHGVARLLGLRGAALLTVQPGDRLQLLARAHLDADGAARPEIRLASDPALLRRLERGRTESLRDLQEDPEIAPETVRALAALGASALAPLRARGHLVGVLVLAAPRTGTKLGYDDLRVLDAIAPAAAIAVENAILVGQQAEKERLAALGGVAAVIVHEIKNPLGIIRLSAGTLRKKFDGGTAGDELGRCIVEEVDRMDTTLRQILSFARPQNPKLLPCNVSQLVGRTLDRMRPQLEAARIVVREDLDGTPPVPGDADQLERVFLNLFVNAREAMADSGGELRVRTRLARDGRGRDALEVRIADSGPGMTDEVRRQLFTPFFSTRRGGTGLGLAIVRQIVTDHGGSVDVESSPGAGATFTITLPMASPS